MSVLLIVGLVLIGLTILGLLLFVISAAMLSSWISRRDEEQL